jgi:hypothetical protein
MRKATRQATTEIIGAAIESSAEIGSRKSYAGFNVNHIIHTVRDLPRPWCGPCSRSRRLTADEQAFCWHIPRRVSGHEFAVPAGLKRSSAQISQRTPAPTPRRPNCAVLGGARAPHQQPCGRLHLNSTSLHFTTTSLPSCTRLAARKRCHERRRPFARVLACLLDHFPAAKKRRHRLSHADRQRPGQPVSCMSSPSSTAPTTLCYSCHHSHLRSYYTRRPVLSR